jgi:chemotaxis methyl-accepting protein methylase
MLSVPHTAGCRLPCSKRMTTVPDAAAAVLTAADRAAADAILMLVRERTGLDLSRYRPATIHRRIRNRMISVGAANLEEYLGLLQSQSTETAPLVDRLTIKVSRFYRNREMFDVLRSDVLPALAAARGDASLTIWCAGCGCGEEAYTFAMLLAERNQPGWVEATDVDPTALERARAGTYQAYAFEELPRELADRYVVSPPGAPPGQGRVADLLRARTRFSRHDLTSACPPPGGGPFDLVTCRNVLIYLQQAAQEQALDLLVGALAPGGVLCLGEAEWPSPRAAEALDVVAGRARIFRKAVSGQGPSSCTEPSI